MAGPQVTRVRFTPDVLNALQVVAAASPWPLEGVENVFPGSHLFEVHNGNQAAYVAVRPLDLAHGRRLDVVGVLSVGERLAPAVMDSVLCGLARGFDAQVLAMCTRRPHIVRGAESQGWTPTGTVAIKVLGAH